MFIEWHLKRWNHGLVSVPKTHISQVISSSRPLIIADVIILSEVLLANVTVDGVLREIQVLILSVTPRI